MSENSDPVPLDGRTPLTEDELLWLRRSKRDHERVRWLGRQLRKWWPVLVAVASAVVAIVQAWGWFVQWAAKHAPKP